MISGVGIWIDLELVESGREREREKINGWEI